MQRFWLKYDSEGVGSAGGEMRVMCGDHELTQDCGSAVEMDRAIDGLKRELDTLKAEAKRKFDKAWKAKMAAHDAK